VAAAALIGPAALTIAEGGPALVPTGNRDRASAPSGIYPCLDGHVYIYGGLDPYWRKLRPIVGGGDAPIVERIANAEEYDGFVTAWTSRRDKAEVLAVMLELGIPAGAVMRPEEALAALRGTRQGSVSRPAPSGEHVPAFPVLFDGKRPARTPAPAIGAERRTD
jgi:crotonobetainyl-CoA:carnitine CoA-transferase CaiB-like acyl-CoA transferase